MTLFLLGTILGIALGIMMGIGIGEVKEKEKSLRDMNKVVDRLMRAQLGFKVTDEAKKDEGSKCS